jgi:hypothetical protein
MSFTNTMEDIIMTQQSTNTSGTREGQTPNTDEDFWGAPISVYTRQQGIEDGVLVDVTAWASSGPEGMLGGFTVPVAITAALWAVVNVGDADSRVLTEDARWRALARRNGESTRGRAHDALWMLRVAVQRNPRTDRVLYPVLMTVEGRRGGLVRRWLMLEARIDGGGITIGLPEDF